MNAFEKRNENDDIEDFVRIRQPRACVCVCVCERERERDSYILVTFGFMPCGRPYRSSHTMCVVES